MSETEQVKRLLNGITGVQPAKLDLDKICDEMLAVAARHMKEAIPPGHTQLLLNNEDIALLCGQISFGLFRNMLASFEDQGPQALPSAIALRMAFLNFQRKATGLAMEQFVEEIKK